MSYLKVLYSSSNIYEAIVLIIRMYDFIHNHFVLRCSGFALSFVNFTNLLFSKGFHVVFTFSSFFIFMLLHLFFFLLIYVFFLTVIYVFFLIIIYVFFLTLFYVLFLTLFYVLFLAVIRVLFLIVAFELFATDICHLKLIVTGRNIWLALWFSFYN